MTRNLIKEILKKKELDKNGLQATLSRIKKRYDLKSIDQAACFYIKKQSFVPLGALLLYFFNHHK